MDYKNIIFVDVFYNDRKSYIFLKYDNKSDEEILYKDEIYKNILKNMKRIMKIDDKISTKVKVIFEDGYIYEYNSKNTDIIDKIKNRFFAIEFLQEEKKKEKTWEKMKL